MASATTVFSLGKIDMTRRSLCYNATLTSPMFPAQPVRPDRSLAHEHIDNNCRRTPLDTIPVTLLVSPSRCGRRNGVTATGNKLAPFRTTNRIQAGDMHLQ